MTAWRKNSPVSSFWRFILTVLALTLVFWLRQDMHQMEERLNERFARLERRLAAAERDRAKSDIAVRAAAE